jgi:hypothetical protein
MKLFVTVDKGLEYEQSFESQDSFLTKPKALGPNTWQPKAQELTSRS